MIMKKQLLLLVMILLPMVASAYDAQINGIYYNLVKKVKVAEVVPSCVFESDWNNQYSGDIVIPATVDYEGVTYNVTSIGRRAFFNCNISSFTIPSSITSIGPEAFYINRSDEECKVYLSDLEAWCNINTDGAANFYVDWRLYLNNEEINDLVLPNTLTEIKYYGPFFYCASIHSVTFPSSMTSTGESSFANCKNLTSAIIPDGIVELSGSTFADCPSLNSVMIGNSIKLIGGAAFLGCTSLKSITIPNSVETIQMQAFWGCRNLTTINIGNGIKEIWFEAFRDCKEMTDVFCYAKEVPSLGDNVFMDSYVKDATLHVPEESVDAYKAAKQWKDFKNIVGIVGPVDGEMTVDTDNLNGQDLTDNVVDGVYYNVGEDGYDATDGSIVISETTNMGQITDSEPGSDDVKNNFTGIILKVAAGKGTIKVNVKTSGNAQLVVQVGKGTPMIATKTEQGEVVVSYDVAEDTYVYIYAIIGSSASPSMRASSTDEVRIYGFTVSPEASGVKAVWANEEGNAQIFSLDGKPLNEPQKGVNIVRMSNGQVRKVVLK